MLGKSSSPPLVHICAISASLTDSLCRHYVAFIRKQLDGHRSPVWVLFNDEKVVESTDIEEMRKFAYVYFFKRV